MGCLIYELIGQIVNPVTGEVYAQSLAEQSYLPTALNGAMANAIFKGLVLVLLVRVLWSYVQEKTKQRKAGDQVLTASEVETAVAAAIKAQGKVCTTKMDGHINLINEKLLQGEKQFKEDRKEIGTLRDAVHQLTTSIAVLNANIEKNGLKIKP